MPLVVVSAAAARVYSCVDCVQQTVASAGIPTLEKATMARVAPLVAHAQQLCAATLGSLCGQIQAPRPLVDSVYKKNRSMLHVRPTLVPPTWM